MKKPWCGRCGIAALCLTGGIEAQYCGCLECKKRFFKLIRVADKRDFYDNIFMREPAWGYVYEDNLDGSPCVFGVVVAEVQNDPSKIKLMTCPRCAESSLRESLSGIRYDTEKER